MTFQAAVSTVLDNRGVETGVVAVLLLAGKVWDRVYGKKKDRELKAHREGLTSRLDEHASSDALAFGKIETNLAVLATKMDVLLDSQRTLDTRLFNQQREL